MGSRSQTLDDRRHAAAEGEDPPGGGGDGPQGLPPVEAAVPEVEDEVGHGDGGRAVQP